MREKHSSIFNTFPKITCETQDIDRRTDFHRIARHDIPGASSRIMKRIIPIFCFSAILVSFFQESAWSGARKPASQVSYNIKVSFLKGRAISFADFDLVYLGDRHVSSPHFPRGFQYFDFLAETASEQVNVSWSSGTGEIGPTEFKIGGKIYLLELRGSKTHGRLEPDELVITRK